MKQALFFASVSLWFCACSYNNTLPTNPWVSSSSTTSNVSISSSVVSSSTASGNMATGSMTASFTPQSDGGKFNPRNVNAVWITDASGALVRTLYARAGQRASYLAQWRKVYTASIQTGVDGVAGATTSSFSPYSGTWDMTKASTSAKVAYGTYTFNMQFADNNTAGPFASVKFSVNGAAFDTTVPSATFPYHKSIHLKYTP